MFLLEYAVRLFYNMRLPKISIVALVWLFFSLIHGVLNIRYPNCKYFCYFNTELNFYGSPFVCADLPRMHCCFPSEIYMHLRFPIMLPSKLVCWFASVIFSHWFSPHSSLWCVLRILYVTSKLLIILYVTVMYHTLKCLIHILGLSMHSEINS